MARILIVDDEVTFRSSVAAVLTRHGHTVLEAEDGRSGLKLLQSQPVDLVITDVMMPDQDGLEVIMAIRDGNIPVPVIAMTGHPEKADLYLKMATTFGARRTLVKPFTMEEILAAIEEIIPGKEPK